MFEGYQPPRIRLRDWRITKNLSVTELAKLTELNPLTIYRLESGDHKKAQPRTAQKLADALGISVFDLTVARYRMLNEGTALNVGAITLGTAATTPASLEGMAAGVGTFSGRFSASLRGFAGNHRFHRK